MLTFCYFYFERNYDLLNSKSPWLLLNKNINFNKNVTEFEIENPPTQLWSLCFSSYKNSELKVNLWCVRARERKKNVFFETFILLERDFISIIVLSQCIVYWINFQNKYTSTYQKTLLHTILMLVFKIMESRYCILK